MITVGCGNQSPLTSASDRDAAISYLVFLANQTNLNSDNDHPDRTQ